MLFGLVSQQPYYWWLFSNYLSYLFFTLYTSTVCLVWHQFSAICKSFKKRKSEVEKWQINLKISYFLSWTWKISKCIRKNVLFESYFSVVFYFPVSDIIFCIQIFFLQIQIVIIRFRVISHTFNVLKLSHTFGPKIVCRFVTKVKNSPKVEK